MYGSNASVSSNAGSNSLSLYKDEKFKPYGITITPPFQLIAFPLLWISNSLVLYASCAFALESTIEN